MGAQLERAYGCRNKATPERLIIGDVVQVLLAESFIRNKLIEGYIDVSGSPTFLLSAVSAGHKTELNGQLSSTASRRILKAFQNFLTALKYLS